MRFHDVARCSVRAACVHVSKKTLMLKRGSSRRDSHDSTRGQVDASDTYPVVYSPVPHSTALTVRDSVLGFLVADMLTCGGVPGRADSAKKFFYSKLNRTEQNRTCNLSLVNQTYVVRN